MLNQAQLIGHVGEKPEVRTMRDGAKVANLSLATTEKWTDDEGELHERTHWHRIVVFGTGIVDKLIKPYVDKGSQLFVQGSIENRKWKDKDDQERFTTEIVVRGFGDAIRLLGKAPNREAHR